MFGSRSLEVGPKPNRVWTAIASLFSGQARERLNWRPAVRVRILALEGGQRDALERSGERENICKSYTLWSGWKIYNPNPTVLGFFLLKDGARAAGNIHLYYPRTTTLLFGNRIEHAQEFVSFRLLINMEEG